MPDGHSEDPALLVISPMLLKGSSRLVVATGVSLGADKFENPVVLFPNEWTMRYFQEKNPELKLHTLPLEQTK